MAPGVRRRPRRYPGYLPEAPPSPPPKQVQLRPPPQRVFRARRPQVDLPGIWLRRTMEAFDQLIHLGESQPSNGTVRKVYPPDGETYFAVAYGDAPDNDLRDVLKSIYAKHGMVTLAHDGRDSTGKHWITSFSAVKQGSLEPPMLKATICVSSKLEMATIPRREAISDKENGKVIRDRSSIESWLEGISLKNDATLPHGGNYPPPWHWPCDSY